MQVNCTFCGALVNRSLRYIERRKNLFCSYVCYHAHQRAGGINQCACAFCGKPITRKPSAIKRYKINLCNQACYTAYQRTGTINKAGYRVIRINGKTIGEHRLVMERHLGRELLPTEHVHHRDRDPLNNSISNLVVMSPVEHIQEHKPLTWDINQAVAMRAQGCTFQKIATFFGVSLQAVREGLIMRGLYTSKPFTLKWDIEAAKAMRAQGVSFVRIAKTFGVAPHSIRIAFTRRGLHVPKSRR